MTAQPTDGRAAWFGRRARNAARRPAVIGVAGSVAFLATAIALATVPRQRQIEARAVAALLTQRVDTAPVLRTLADAERELARAEGELGAARRRAASPAPPPPADTFPPALIARRDSLARSRAALAAMIDRVENAPLPASYRALGEMPEVRGDARVAALLDSLAAIEQQRDAYATAGGVNPAFVALTARATIIGRQIQAIAQVREDSAGAELARLRPPAPPPVIVVSPVDTLPLVERRDARAGAVDSALRALGALRDRNADIERRASSARTAANVVVPPLAMLAAALIVGAGAGFASALMLEIRHPRVADAGEAEIVTGARAVPVIRPPRRDPERSRRRVDREMSPHIEPESEMYRLVHLQIAASDPRVSLVTVTGADRAVTATVAANVAAAAAADTRTTLLIDSDPAGGLVASLVRVRDRPGLAEVVAGQSDWMAAIVPATIGRDRTLDVIPRGGGGGTPVPSPDPDIMRAILARIARQYDLVVIAAPSGEGRPAARGMPAVEDVVYCAVAGATRLTDLQADLAALRGGGARLRGVVLWDGPAPTIDGAREIDVAPDGAATPVPLSAPREDR